MSQDIPVSGQETQSKPKWVYESPKYMHLGRSYQILSKDWETYHISIDGKVSRETETSTTQAGATARSMIEKLNAINPK